MMRYYLLALGCVVLIKAVVGSQGDFCNLECPEFDSVRSTSDYEVRRYSDTKWVSTKVSSMNYGIASMRGFWKLFAYIGGENEAGVKIEMTQPVLIKIPEETSWWLWKEYTVSFMLPREHWDSPPMPTNTDVYIDHMPESTAYVKSYGGWANGWNTNSNRQEVEQKLTEAGETFEDSFYYSAAYNAPFEMTNRHNEVWVMSSNGRK
ncbi:heme-binding protein 2-like [Branchiostoma lanceolatum]|uniref:heme-binding protein 2-like n=1 Tax=Branchiostoma lanceolatum TaxID=7740 RepID=UPI00345556D8